MHTLLILLVFCLAWQLRLLWVPAPGNWTQRWHRALFFFLLPPLLLVFAAIAVLCMEPRGEMIGLPADWLGNCIVAGWLGCILSSGGRLIWDSARSLQSVRSLEQRAISPHVTPARLLETPQLFCAQIGFWQPELVISTGLLQTLSPQHLSAVLAHERAHEQHRDTFWFFWLGGLRRITSWLPQTEALWQELLTLRELRADRVAAQTLDPLLVAEALIAVVSDGAELPNFSSSAAFGQPLPGKRLQERINALLAPPETPQNSPWWAWSWGILAFLPLLPIAFHR